MVDQRQPVPEPFEALQEPDQPGVIQRFEGPILHQFQEVVEAEVEIVQGLFDLWWIPDVHTHILLEHAFDHKQNHQENKENPVPSTSSDYINELRAHDAARRRN